MTSSTPTLELVAACTSTADVCGHVCLQQSKLVSKQQKAIGSYEVDGDEFVGADKFRAWGEGGVDAPLTHVIHAGSPVLSNAYTVRLQLPLQWA